MSEPTPPDQLPRRIGLIGAVALAFNGAVAASIFALPGSLDYRDARNFASITSMRNTPRQFQLGAKVYW